MPKANVGTARLEQTGCDLPGVVEDGMPRRADSESVEPLGGRLASFCRETQNSTSKQAFVGFFSLFFS
jgi:hypothetical protein